MADSKQDQGTQGTPKPGDVRAFGAGVQSGDANKQGDDANKPAPSPKTGGQGVDGPQEIPGGAYIVNGQVLDANGNVRDDYEAKDGQIVKKGDTSRKADDAK